MARSDDLIYRRNQYIDCRNKAREVANHLGDAINNLNNLIALQKNAYQVDSQSPVTNFLSDVQSRQRSIYNNITGNVIPNTNSIINDLNYQISDAMQAEALEAEENR